MTEDQYDDLVVLLYYSLVTKLVGVVGPQSSICIVSDSRQSSLELFR